MNIKVQTDQTGSNQNVCSGSSLTFNFSIAQNATLDTANFVIKKGSSTTASITATIYDQKNGAGNVVASISVLAADITQTFNTISFLFNTALTGEVSYSLVVSSTSSCSGSSPYSMKSGNFQILDSITNSIVNIGYGISANILNYTSFDSSLIQMINISSNNNSNVNMVVQAQKIQNVYSTITCNNIISANSIQNVKISSCIKNISKFEAQAIRILPDSTNHIRIDGKGLQSGLKIYLGNKQPRIYHKNRIIKDKP